MKIKNTTNPLIAELYVTFGETISLVGQYLRVMADEDLPENKKKETLDLILDGERELTKRIDRNIEALVEEIKTNGKNQRYTAGFPNNSPRAIWRRSDYVLKSLKTLMNFVNKDNHTSNHCVNLIAYSVKDLLEIIKR